MIGSSQEGTIFGMLMKSFAIVELTISDGEVCGYTIDRLKYRSDFWKGAFLF